MSRNSSYKTLEYDKLKKTLSDYTVSELGREYVDEMEPITDKHEIMNLLSLCSEAKELYQRLKGFPLDGLKDISNILWRYSKPGTILDTLQFLEISKFVRVARNVKRSVSANNVICPGIWNLVMNLSTFPALSETIDSCIDEEGAILDNASQELRRIRRQKGSIRENIRSKLESIMRSSEYGNSIQDNVITIRNERFVIPIKKDYKSWVSGIVQGESNSGATVFMEPESVVSLNNDLQKLASEEKQEIRRILLSLSDAFREYLDEFENAIDILGQIDFLGAKAKLSIDFHCSPPILNSDGYIHLIEARHPLLELTIKERKYEDSESDESLLPDKIIPIDFEIGDEFNTLIITGPNTGGKTVALKTVGLLVLMAQSGLHIPAIDGSEIGIFERVFADIGDEQSIEQNLSTFSSHIKKIIDIVDNANSDSLVLLDEIGAGTDPTEGSAIGMAVVDYLHSIGSKIVVTTHHGSLKAYAHSKEGMENACVEFDWHTLLPTYRLQIGVPGSSNALKIAEKIGLAGHIIHAAKEYIGSSSIAIEDLIVSMEESRRELEKERRTAQEEIEKASEAKSYYEDIVKELKEQREEFSLNAERDALTIVKSARRKIENAIEQIKKEQASKKSIKEAHKTVDSLEKELKSKRQKKARTDLQNKLKVGDKVRIKSMERFAEVVSKPEKGEVEVQAENIRIILPLNDIEFIDSEFNKPKLSQSVVQLHHLKKSLVKDEIQIRGKRVHEAVKEVDKYIDDAFLAGLSRVRIIHGKGTGTLKDAVRDLLDEHPHVLDYHFAPISEGGYGVTIANLEK